MTDPRDDARELDVVICTYANAEGLDLVLDALERQRGDGAAWGVTVVFNNSPADTRAVVARHEQRGRIPGLQTVEEPEQGLTPARLRGVRDTTGRWIAFVDDDCILDDTWVEHALAFARSHPGYGGFGGRVVPEYEKATPLVSRSYGWAFAEQDLGEAEVEVDCLVGAGMVLSRAALDESGWLDGPYFRDRVGRRLVSGGDVELALRVAATGRPLWYTPACTLGHLIPAQRTTTSYLVRIIRGLGISSTISGALRAPVSRLSWARTTVREIAGETLDLLKSTTRLVRGRDGRADVWFKASYVLGRLTGVARVGTLMARGRCDFYGKAHGAVRAG